MSNYKQTDTKVYAKIKQLSPENIYWKKFNIPVLLKEYGPVDYIHFSPVEPYNFAATSSAKVQIYNPITKQVHKNLNKFKQTAFGGSFRKDGQLLCAGSEDSVVRLFDISSRSILRMYKGHTAAVHRTFFTEDKIHIVSFSDDKSAKIWDLQAEKSIIEFHDHKDYIRAGCVSAVSKDILLSGGYDGIINLYDSRTSNSVFTFDHGSPVESLLFLPSGGIFISAGGKEIRIWDVFTRSLLTKCAQFHKTVTCMCLASKGRRLLAGSLDRRIKVFDLSNYKLVQTMSYTSPILSVAMSPMDDTLVTGTVSGVMSVQKRGEEIEKKTKTTRKVSHRYFSDTLRGKNIVDIVALPARKDHLPRYEVALRKFQYTRAVDLVMVQAIAFKKPYIVVTVFAELIRRKGLVAALSFRESKDLAKILRFLIKFINIEQFTKTLLEVANCLIDCYFESINSYSMEVKSSFRHLRNVVKREEETTLELLKLQGALEMIFSASNL